MRLTSRQLYALRKQLKVSQRQMGQLVGRSRWSIDRWERGVIAIPDRAQVALTQIAAEHRLVWVRGMWCRPMTATPTVPRVERN